MNVLQAVRKNFTLGVAVMAVCGLLLGAAGSAVSTHFVSADAADQIGIGKNATSENPNDETSLEKGVETITNILLFLIGLISVVVIVIGGIKYTTSNGDQGAVASAKNTIMYAVVGLVVAIMAYGIVNWVIRQF